MWVYQQTEPGLWTVGYYDPAGKWHSDSDHDNRSDARDRCHYLNGHALESPERCDDAGCHGECREPHHTTARDI